MVSATADEDDGDHDRASDIAGEVDERGSDGEAKWDGNDADGDAVSGDCAAGGQRGRGGDT